MLAVCKFRGVAFSGVKAVPCAIGAGRPGAAALVCGQFGQKSNVKYEYSACPFGNGAATRVRGSMRRACSWYDSVRTVCLYVCVAFFSPPGAGKAIDPLKMPAGFGAKFSCVSCGCGIPRHDYTCFVSDWWQKLFTLIVPSGMERKDRVRNIHKIQLSYVSRTNNKVRFFSFFFSLQTLARDFKK